MIEIRDIILLKEAVDDLENGRSFYESSSIGLGNYFWDTLLSDFDSLFLYAGIHIKEFGFYKFYSKRFPYAIYYTIDNEIIIIAAVLPMRRDPVWIEKSIKNRN